MKNRTLSMSGIIALVLVAALTLGMGVLAEEADIAAAETEQTEQTAEDTQLQDAFDAYCTAKQANRASDLEQELASMVEQGQLTQEQADLMLEYYNEQISLRNGVCPGCGYEFQQGAGRRVKNGGKGGLGMGNVRGMGNGFRAN